MQEARLGTVWHSKSSPHREVQVVEVATKHIFYENLVDRACFCQTRTLFTLQYDYVREAL